MPRKSAAAVHAARANSAAITRTVANTVGGAGKVVSPRMQTVYASNIQRDCMGCVHVSFHLAEERTFPLFRNKDPVLYMHFEVIPDCLST